MPISALPNPTPSSPPLPGLLKNAATEFPSRCEISVPGKLDITHARLQELVDAVVVHLAASGIRPYDIVTLTFPNTVEELLSLFLSLNLGLGQATDDFELRIVFATCDNVPCRDLSQEEFKFYLSDSESKLLITNPEGNAVEQATMKIPRIPHATAVLSNANESVEIWLKIGSTNSD